MRAPMSDEILKEQALILVERAHRHQLKGEYGLAIALYQRSLTVWPTAEAHTYLGWTYSLLDRYEDAIEQCEKAIELDPNFGNPYNDIGAYLIEMELFDEAIPWLEKAIAAERYETPYFPLLNLGRAYQQLGQYRAALAYYDQALAIDPFDRETIWAKFELLGQIN